MSSKHKRSDEGHPLKVKYRDGSFDKLMIREMTHDENNERQRILFGPMGRKQKGGMRQIRLDKQREYDFKLSILDWKEEDENGEFTVPVDFRDKGFLEGLPRYVSEQIFNFIDELNEEPEDEVAPSENGHDVEVVEEDPTYTSSASSATTG